MTEPKPFNLPLIAMLMVYLLCAVAAFGNFFIGLMFGSEIYRDRGIPLLEWALIAGPLVVTVAMLIATIVFWNKGNRRIPYALFVVLLLGVLGYASYLTGYLPL